MPDAFVAIDVETANADLASICQIGTASFESGELVGQWTSLVNPDDYFDPLNVSIHGIDEAGVASAPRFPGLVRHLRRELENSIVLSHMPFDRVALRRACESTALPRSTVHGSIRLGSAVARGNSSQAGASRTRGVYPGTRGARSTARPNN